MTFRDNFDRLSGGEVAERLKAVDSKSTVRICAPQVRILSSPPFFGVVFMNLFLIDIDNTVYPKQLGVFDAIDIRINQYMKNLLGMNDEQIDKLRKFYWNKYGTTMSGLIKHYHIDPYRFLDYVHDIDVESLIKPNPLLFHKINSIKAVKIAFTNAPKKHAVRVLEALGIIELFVDIFDIISADFKGKPNRYAYEKIINKTKADRYAMIDDWEVNLKTAKELGFFTVLVSKEHTKNVDLCVQRFEDLDENNLKFNMIVH